jgi:hypothetical protein
MTKEIGNNTQHGDIIVLEWTFTPTDYFEESVNLESPDYTVTVDNGKIEARISAEVFEMKPTLKDTLHEKLNDLFLGVQLVEHRPYKLSKASMCRLHPDGRKDITVFPEPGLFALASGTADIIMKDKNGNVIVDSKRDRIRKKRELATLAKKYRGIDLTAASLLGSYKMALDEPNNELVHLYEIRDALSKRFRGAAAACNALDIPLEKWSRLGTLANFEPLKEGRHRGKNPGALRGATNSELEEGRNIATSFVEAYLLYLKRSSIGNS